MYSRALDRGLLVLLSLWAVASILPVGAWTGVAAPGYYGASVRLWWWTLLVATLATVLLLVVSAGRVARWLRALLARALASSPRAFLAVAGGLASLEAVATSWLVFDRTSPLIDGWVQELQARIFLSGRLVAPAPFSPAHFATLFMPITDRGWFSQYPPLHAGLLAVGAGLGASWLVTPLLAAALPAAVYRLARPSGDERVARLAAVLVLLSPFLIAMNGSAMNHLPAALCVTLGLWAATDARRGPVRAGALFGAMVGLIFGLRPPDAMVLAGVGGMVLALTAARAGLRRLVAAFAVAAAAGLATLAPTLVYNAATTGDPLTFTYAAIWGDLLGFAQTVPWGQRLTAARAIGNTAVDAHQLNVYLLEWPVPATALIALGLMLGGGRLPPNLRACAAYLLGMVALLFFYFHRDTLFGPRLLFSAMPPLLVLLAAALVRIVDWRRALGWRALTAGDVALVALTVTALLAAAALAPRRLASYRTAGTAVALHPEEDARSAGITHAVVVIPDGWGSRLIVRLWAAGIPMRDSTRIYDAFDACTLEERLGEAERERWNGAELRARLDAELASADAGRPVRGLTRDPSLRLPETSRLTPRCAEEIRRDQRGTLQFAPYVHLNTPTLDGDIVWARELGAGDAVLAQRYPGRPLYRYVGPTGDGRPSFMPVSPAASSGAEVKGENAVAEE